MTKKLIITRNGNQLVDLTPEEETFKQQEEQEFLTSAPSEFDMAINSLRVKRNALLTETDWTVLPDSPVSDKTAWQNYRTELRDLTNGLTTVEQVEAVTWPTKPGA